MDTLSTKRSSTINRKKMRKHFALKPLIIGMSATFLTACGDNDTPAEIYTSIEECTLENPGGESQCKAAYEDALEEAARTAPRFGSEYDCEYDFGPNQCRQSSSGGFFFPFMAGYMVSNLLSPSRYYTQPMYTSYSRYSPYRSRWMMADGYVFDGDIRKRSHRVNKEVYKPKPTVSRTIKRGGFGSSVRAKSSWGSSSRSGGWGG
ncbi:DUF1190 domain-containing protein [Alteromonas sp. 5E99-2]|uniref:DUF1190 domain-containing protein n=1 Tax=Alteromonas sp. 5E99-2 TaxID=2817683 RepID=UPI001A9945DA|nr:DUF1190 domain-containing protein [Alteromonas sp. 5E99-2]MBO1256518.1 DUF1190 domain-containing protein [Alteromonas sp. 5E99-2]